MQLLPNELACTGCDPGQAKDNFSERRQMETNASEA